MNSIEPLDKLTSLLGRLPGVGRRSAERMALKLARDSRGLVRDLIGALQEVDAKVCACSLCGGITLRARTRVRSARIQNGTAASSALSKTRAIFC